MTRCSASSATHAATLPPRARPAGMAGLDGDCTKRTARCRTRCGSARRSTGRRRPWAMARWWRFGRRTGRRLAPSMPPRSRTVERLRDRPVYDCNTTRISMRRMCAIRTATNSRRFAAVSHLANIQHLEKKRTAMKALRLLVAALPFTVAAFAAPKPAPLPSVDIPYEKFVLANGLTLIVHEDHKAPIVAVNVWYHVGSKDEHPGRTGFAHLFEHLMFNGSENYKDDWFKVMESAGATKLNGTTWYDR